MDNNSVSKFIDKIVLNFEDNYVVKNILSKLSDMYKSSNITIDGNTIISQSKSMKRIINVDLNNKKLGVQDITNNDDKQFYNEITYTVQGNKSTHHKYSTIIETNEEKSDLLRKTGYIYDTYEYFNNNKIVGASDTKTIIEELQTSVGEVLKREKNEFNRMLYGLPNGDVIKIIKDNDNCKYYYCEKQVLKNRTLSIEQQKTPEIGVELSQKQAESILKFSSDAYTVANNKTVYGIRGTSYR